MSERNWNPPIKGHHLLYEGLSQPVYDWDGKIKDHAGGCACGMKPPGWPNCSGREVKKWHRTHKAEIRSFVERPGSVSTHGGEDVDSAPDGPESADEPPGL